MVSVAEAFVTLRPDLDGFGRAAESGVKRGMSGIAKAGLLGAGLAVAGVGKLLGDAIGDAGESRRIARITAQSIKTTGGAARVSAKHVGNMSTSLGEMSGVDDEVIQQGANLLLTFKNVRNEAGEGSKVFDRATRAGLDMAAQGFGTPETNAKQLGKALQDPLKGITALSRAGVTFTEDQKKQIETMVESNDLLGAQKLILDEVEGQVGGAAKASADPMARLSVVAGNLKEQMGTALLPVVDRLATFMSDKLPGAVKAVTDAFDRDGLAGVIGLVAGKIGDALPGILTKLGEWGQAFLGWIGPRIPPLLEKLGELAARVGEWMVNTALPWLMEKVAQWGKAFVDWVGPQIAPLLEKLLTLLNAVGNWIINEGLPKLATKLGEWAAAFAKWAVDAIPKMIENLGKFLRRILSFTNSEAGPKIESGWSKIGTNLVDAFWQGIKDEWPNLLAKLGNLANDVFDFMGGGWARGETGEGFSGGDFAAPAEGEGTGGGRSFSGQSLPTPTKGLSVGSITINNPAKAVVEEDLPRALRRASWVVPA